MRKGRQDTFDDSNHSKNRAHNIQSSVKVSDSSLETMPKGRHYNVDASNNSKNDRGNKLSSDKCSDSSPALNLKGRHDRIDESSSSSVSGGKPESLTNSLNKRDLGVGSGFSNNVNATVTHSKEQYKPEKWMLPDQAEDTLTQLNLAIVSQPLTQSYNPGNLAI